MAQQKVSIQSDLSTFVQQKEGTPFLWGFNDCCTFAGDWFALRTGVDVLGDLRGITDGRQALRKLEEIGGVEKAVSDRLGQPIPPLQAGPGAVVLLHGDGGQVLGVCLGDKVGVAGDLGLEYVSLELGVAAWLVT
jgi:hypothetical protein